MKRFIPLLMLVLVMGCQTDKMLLKDRKGKSFSLMAKVFNGRNRALPGVTVTLTSEKGKVHSAQTDITGKVIFPDIPFGPYQAAFTLDAYEMVEFSFEFLRPDQALYGRLYSVDSLLENSQAAIDKQDWGEAESWLKRAEALDSRPVLAGFLRAILLWKQGNPADAVRYLERLALQHETMPAEVTLFTADLYQYDLDKSEKAIEFLDLYLQQVDDAAVAERRVNLDQIKGTDVEEE